MGNHVTTAEDFVVLLDAAGQARGVRERSSVHSSSTPLHLAFSSYLFDSAGRVLLTRRALGKPTWPGVWTNSCCGHPRPGESLQDAVRRRVREELGMRVDEVEVLVPEFRYRARDASGIVENEVCPVLVGRVDPDDFSIDPSEVMETAWVPWADLTRAVASTPAVFSPWCVLQVPRVEDALRARSAAAPRSVAECVADVDAMLASEIADLQRLWDDFNRDEGVEVLPQDLPAWLSRLLVGQGKRLRVVIAYWGYVASGGRHDAESYGHLVRLAAALETLHLFALVHDDIMDESSSRRGRPSAHVEAAAWHVAHGAHGDPDLFGRNLAVLLGDLAHTVADRMVDSLPAELRRVWYELCTELIAGQRADLTGAAAGRRDRAHAEHIARLKSGRYTIERPLQLGAIVAGSDADARAGLLACGAHIGRAFALRDDYLGVWGDPQRTGKPAVDDLAEAKATVIMALAAERLTGDAAQALDRLGTPRMLPGDVDVVSQALVAAGVRDEIETMIAAHVERADACLDAAGLTPEGVAGLKRAARAVAWRDS